MDDTEDLNRLIRELNADGPGSAAASGRTRPAAIAGEPSEVEAVRLDGWLEELVRRAGSDLILVAGAAPSLRIDGRVMPLSAPPLSGDEIEEAVLPALGHHARSQYRETGAADASHRVRGVGRFRINLHRERGRAAATVRALPTQPPRLSTLGLPPGVESLTHLPRGLVLIGGPTGSGKSTTLAALVDEINRREARHIVTIEDPVEYEHPHRSSLIEQVEVGIDTPDFPTALRAAMRQAPDVVVVGEMRDPETMRIALAASETGHLVFSTVHTTDAASTVSRVADSFPSERQNTIRQELSMSLAAVMTQTLLPRKGGGRAAAAELLFVGYGAKQHIRKNALQHLHQEIAITRKQGSITLEESLAKLVRDGIVEVEEARARAAHPEEFENYLRGGV
ncbi:MAG TPA: PilT/PilU family type 4a pilus ATPase [Thermoanaerobaculia bacterium]|nr:PilT/PilU family type 4a pilus ATPase [Thermoanaerobaculia bacterium]